MTVTAFLSMWISNTATCAMMLPLSLGLLGYIGAEPGKSRYGTSLMLGIAWAASIGGVGSLIGTPPNGIAVGVLNAHFAHDPSYHRITFLDWMTFGVPLVVCFLPVAWLVLIKLFPPEVNAFEGGKKRLLDEFHRLGKFSRGEKGSVAVFSLAVVLWLTLPFRAELLPAGILSHIEWLDEYTTGLIAGLLLFIIPVRIRERTFLLHWKDLRNVEWGALAIVGGGIALSDAMFKTGFASWIATSFISMVGSPSTVVMMFAVVFFIDFLTEIATNSAVISMMAPVVISIAQRTGENPVALAVAAAIASSMAFMLPVATPPNAIVYGTGYVKMKDMMRAGIVLDILGWLLAIGVLLVFGWMIFGVFSL
jgi:sodium-dependent dicarboxylate transporter 2/3/5